MANILYILYQGLLASLSCYNVILFLTRQHQIDMLHILRQRSAVLFAQMLSLVRYIQPLANWRKCMQHSEMKDSMLFFFFGGRLASLGIHENTPLDTPDRESITFGLCWQREVVLTGSCRGGVSPALSPNHLWRLIHCSRGLPNLYTACSSRRNQYALV